MSPILCPHCGTANRAGSNFCNRCGASLRNEAPPGDRHTPAAEPAGEPAPSSPAPTEPGTEARLETVPTSAAEDGEQPWLQADYVAEGDLPLPPSDEREADRESEAGADVPVASGRLVSGIQGLIEPVRVAVTSSDSLSEPPLPAVAGMDVDRLRRVRMLMGEEPLLAAALPSARLPARYSHSLWIPWVFMLIGLAIAIPVFWQLYRPAGVAREWPGVTAAYAAIESLPPQATVQLLWAYDPATAGELDLVAAPIVRHLLDKGAQLQIVSLLPNGPASARRLVAEVHAERSQLRRGVGETVLEPPRFLPGGVLALPLLGQQPADLAVVFAAQAEDVQAWLEQVAPRNRAPVVAATGAGGDPLLRPYWAAGQLVGLVSGFDGAASYTALLGELPARARERQLQLQLVGQNLATVVFLLLIVAGNVAILVTGRRSGG